MRRSLAVVSALLVLTSCSHLSGFGLHMGDVKLPLDVLTYPSGLRVLIEEDHRAPVAGVVSIVSTGAADDPQGKEGLAHFLEHLTFRARPDGRTQVASVLEDVGAGDWNAETGFDSTMFYEFAPKESLKALIALEGARLANPLMGLDPATFTVEREVVRNELRLRNETEYPGEVMGWIQQAVFPTGHPYARPLGGTQQSLGAITPADVDAFVKAHYQPQNITIVITGDVTIPEVQRLLAGLLPFSLTRASKDRAPAPTVVEPPAPPAHALYRYTGAVPTPTLYLAWSLPSSLGQTAALEDFVQSSFNDQLGEAFLDDDDIISISSNVIPGAKGSLLICEVLLREGSHPEKTAGHVLDKLVNLWTRGSKAQFDVERMIAVDAIASMAEDVRVRAQLRAEGTVLTHDPATFTRELTDLNQLGIGDIEHFAYQYLSRERAREVFVSPLPGTAAPPEGSKVTAIAPGDDVDARYSLAAIANIAHGPGLSAVKTLTLPNGLEVVIDNRPGWPQATVALALPGGEGDARPLGVADLVRLAEHGNAHGQPALNGVLSRRLSAEDETVLLETGGSGDVSTLLATMSDRVQGLSVKGDVLDRYEDRVLPGMAKLEATPREVARRAFRKAIFGEGAYGAAATSADEKQRSASEVNGWIDGVYQPNGAVLAVVGELDPAQVEADARSYFGGWSGAGAPKAPEVTLASMAQAPQVLLAGRPGATQEQVWLGCAVKAGSIKDQVAFDLLAEALSDELDDTARKTLGATYGFHGQATALRGGVESLQISGDVDNAHFADVVKVLDAKWSHLGEKPLGEQEVNRARWALARKYDLRFLTAEDLALAAVTTREHGLPLSALDLYPHLVTALPLSEINAAAKACHARSVISVLGDTATAKAALGTR